MTLDELSNYTGFSRKYLIDIFSSEDSSEDETVVCKNGVRVQLREYGVWENGAFTFHKNEFAEGEPTDGKLDEDKRREDYIKQHGKEQVEQEEAKLEINY